MKNSIKPNIKPNTSLVRPRVTEKAALQGAKQNVYVFEVKADATKSAITHSIKEVYGVTADKIRMLAIPRKKIMRRGIRGSTGGGKKAYVYLKKGDKIESV
jgi:large subunit ribosomal protein L23